MAYPENVKKHLCAYKRLRFPNLPNGYWVRSNPPKELCYAFNPNDRDYNLIENYRVQFLAYEANLIDRITRHMYFHHMNSSQAMCFNFFFPLYKDRKLELVTNYFGFPGEEINYDSVRFEQLSEIEPAYGHSPTNFDFYFETGSGKKFFFEIKYTESQFAKAPMDEDHIRKYEKVYSNHLTAISPNFQGCQQFLGNYQLMRNLIHAGSNSYVVLVFPGENARIKREAEMGKNQIVKEEFKQNILTIEWRNIFDRVNANLQPGELKNQFEEFGRKYFLEAQKNENDWRFVERKENCKN